MLAQQGDERWIDEAFVADLHRVPQSARRSEGDAGTALDLRVAARAPAPRLHPCRAGACPEIDRSFARVVAKIGRQLPKEGAELVAQVGDAGGEEVRERRLDVVKTQHVRDIARALDAEDEARRRVVVPGGVILGSLQRIERAVELDRRQGARRVFELPVLRQALGVKRSAAPRRVAPAGDADADCAGPALALGFAVLMIRPRIVHARRRAKHFVLRLGINLRALFHELRPPSLPCPSRAPRSRRRRASPRSRARPG